MATLPNTYARRPTPRFGGAETAAPVVESGDIAIGQGIQALGKGMGQYLIRAKADRDQIALEDYTTRAKARALELRREYEQKKGADASQDKEFYTGTMDKFSDMRKELLNEVTDADVHKALEQRLDLAGINFQEGLIRHITLEGDAYGDQVYKNGVGLAQNEMGEFADDDSRLLQARNDLKRYTEIQAQRKGIPLNSPVYKNMLRENLTQGHVNVIKALVEDGNTPAAADYFKEFKKEINGDVHDNIDKLLKSAGIRGQSQAAVNEYFDGGLTETEANARARKEFAGQPEALDAVLARIKARYGEDAAIEAREQAAAGEQARSIYANMIDEGVGPVAAYDAIPETVLDAMDSAERISLQSKMQADASGKPVRTDPKAYFEVLDWIQQNPGEPLDLSKFSHLISLSDLKTLRTQMDKDPQILRTQTQIINDGLLAVDLEGADLTKDSGAGEQARDFRLHVEGRMAAIPDATNKDLIEIVEDAVLEVKRYPGRWPWFQGKRPAFEAEVEGVPQDMVAELAGLVADAGREVSDENIRILWEAIQRRNSQLEGMPARIRENR